MAKNIVELFGEILLDLENKKSGKFREELNALNNIGDKVSYVYSCLESIDGFPNIEHENNGKSSELSVAAREKGNRCVASNKFSTARRLYTESIAFAPLKSEALAIAYANRSVVLLKMGYNKECLLDIQRAFCNGYPVHLKYKALAREGNCFKLLGYKNQAYNSYAAAIENLEYSHLDEEAKKALKAKYVEEGKSTVEDDSEILLDIAAISLKPTLEVPELSFNRSEELLCASDCVELKYNEDVGRHLVANRDLQPGDVVLVEEPYVAHLYPKFLRCMCCHCGLRCFALLPCATCNWAMFCSTDCQQAAEEIHKMECSIMSILYKLNADSCNINVMKIILKTGFKQLATFIQKEIDVEVKDKRTAGFTNGTYDSSNFNTVYHSQNKSRQRLFEEMALSLIGSAVCIKLLKNIEPNALEYGGIINHLFWCLQCNGAEMREVYKGRGFPPAEHDVATGGAYYPTYNLVNNSCDPSLGRDFFGFRVVLRAIKPVKKGEELSLAYHYRFTYFEKNQRQLLLFLKNGFECKCKACEGDWPLVDDMPWYPSFTNSTEEKAYLKSAVELDPLHEQVLMGEVITPAMAFRFTKHLTLLSRLDGGRLCQHFNLCQQALEQYWARQSNYFVDNYW